MGKHRPADLLLADAMKEVERLKVKTLHEQLNQAPAVKSLVHEKDSLNKEIIKLRRQLGISDESKGYDATIHRLNFQIKETIALKVKAESRLPDVEERLAGISGELTEVKAALVADMEA